jgi:hypothetical protein
MVEMAQKWTLGKIYLETMSCLEKTVAVHVVLLLPWQELQNLFPNPFSFPSSRNLFRRTVP